MKWTFHTHDKPKTTPTMKYMGLYQILRSHGRENKKGGAQRREER
jgi:hypothetical protein